MKNVLFIVLALSTLPATGQLRSPQIGIAHFADGTLRVVHGIPANLIVSETLPGHSDAAAFSDAGGLTAHDGLIRLLRADGASVGKYQSAEKHPLLDIQDGPNTAVAWLPSERTLLTWNGSAFIRNAIHDSAVLGRATYVRLKNDQAARFLVTNADTSVVAIDISLTSGSVTSIEPLPGIFGPSIMFGECALFQDSVGLVLILKDGTRQELLALPAASRLTMEPMSANWLHLYSSITGENWAVHLEDSKADVFSMPFPSSKEGN